MKRWGYKGIIVFILGIAMMLLGLNRGEGFVVLQKAINVCMECIGLG